MTATVRTHKGVLVTGVVRAWHGQRLAEVEDDNGNRHIGTIEQEAKR